MEIEDLTSLRKCPICENHLIINVGANSYYSLIVLVCINNCFILTHKYDINSSYNHYHNDHDYTDSIDLTFFGEGGKFCFLTNHKSYFRSFDSLFDFYTKKVNYWKEDYRYLAEILEKL